MLPGVPQAKKFGNVPVPFNIYMKTNSVGLQMLAKRDAMQDQGNDLESGSKGKKKARDSDEDSDDDGAGGGEPSRERDTTDRRRRKALEGSSNAAAVKPSRQVRGSDQTSPERSLGPIT